MGRCLGLAQGQLFMGVRDLGCWHPFPSSEAGHCRVHLEPPSFSASPAPRLSSFCPPNGRSQLRNGFLVCLEIRTWCFLT